MTDDDKALVERLRDFVIAEDIDLAADRIEALSAENEQWKVDCNEAALENRRLREALIGIVKFGERHPGHGYSCATIARAALGDTK